jgi:hypothetical protein
MWLVALAALCTGCVLRDDIVHVTLRDPTQVAVQSHDAVILPAGAQRGEIPSDAYRHDPVEGSWVERDSPTTLDAWCPECRGFKRRTINLSPELALDGTADLVRFEHGMLHARFVYADITGHGRHQSARPRLELELVTPASNVAAIDYEAHVSDRNGGSPTARFDSGGLVFAVAYALGGAALTVFGRERNSLGVELTGCGMMAVGAVAGAFFAHLRTATDEHTAIPIPR